MSEESRKEKNEVPPIMRAGRLREDSNEELEQKLEKILGPFNWLKTAADCLAFAQKYTIEERATIFAQYYAKLYERNFFNMLRKFYIEPEHGVSLAQIKLTNVGGNILLTMEGPKDVLTTLSKLVIPLYENYCKQEAAIENLDISDKSKAN